MVKLNLQLFAKAVTDSIVNDVIRGKYGNGDARKTALANAGYNYSEVQSAVNAKLKGTSSGTTTTTNTQNLNNAVVTPADTTPASTNPTFDGVDQKYVDMAYEEFKGSAQADEYLANRNENAQKYEDKINAGPQFSESVTQAFDWLQGQQDYFKNGKTSWDDKIYGQIEKIENREKFSYDVDNDQLFQQALASAMNSGKTAMQDTIGQASALTGGYGSTYATSAGNQAYNSFIEDAYNNLPQYYQMALSAYQAEGEDMYNLLGMYTQMGETEWNRNVDAYNTVFDYANSQRNFEYGMYQDEVTNLYNTTSMYDSFYQQQNTQDLTLWQQSIDNAWKTIGQQSSDYQFEQNYNQTEKWNDKNFGLKQNEYKVSTGDTNMDGVLSPDEIAKMNTSYSYDADGNLVKGTKNSSSDGQNWAQSEYNNGESKYKSGGEKALTDYAEAIGKQHGWDDTMVDNFVDAVRSGNDAVSAGISVSGFKTNAGDNFKITIGENTYKVENEGKVESQKTLDSIANGKTYGDITIADNGNAYIKQDDVYYRIGNLNKFIEAGISKQSGYSDLLSYLSKFG